MTRHLPFTDYTGSSWLGQAARYAVPAIVRRLVIVAGGLTVGLVAVGAVGVKFALDTAGRRA